MSVSRTIYTQGAVSIVQASGVGAVGPAWFQNSLTGFAGGTGVGGLFLSGVQSVNYTVNSPKLDVNAFGVLGPINKVQVEPQTATMEVSIVVNGGNSGTDPHWLSGLVTDAQQPLPSGVIVTASGIGQISGAVLSAVRLEASVGALPTMTLTFDGVSGLPQTAGSPPSTPNSLTVPVVTPDAFGTLFWVNGPSSSSGCPQTVRASWEFPVERINCLGNNINRPTIFSRPPGTMSFTAEGVDSSFVSTTNYLTGVQIGVYKISNGPQAIKETARTANMAVGEAASTFNITSEGVGLGASIDG